jgi:hypothetical protein
MSDYVNFYEDDERTRELPDVAPPRTRGRAALGSLEVEEMGKFRIGRFLKGVARGVAAVGTGGASEVAIRAGKALAKKKRKAKGKLRMKRRAAGGSAPPPDGDVAPPDEIAPDPDSDVGGGDDEGGGDEGGEDEGGEDEGIEGIGAMTVYEGEPGPVFTSGQMAGFSFKKLVKGVGKGLSAVGKTLGKGALAVGKVGLSIGKGALQSYIGTGGGVAPVSQQLVQQPVVKGSDFNWKSPIVIGGGAVVGLGLVYALTRGHGSSSAAAAPRSNPRRRRRRRRAH